MSKIVPNPISTKQRPGSDGLWRALDHDEMVDLAISTYGSEAATAAAYCALDAWTDGRHHDYGFWFEVFLRLRKRGLM